MYFGNNNGLLEFNGTKWRLYPSPNGSIVRAVKVIGKMIYTGCYMEMGYWKRDGKGDLEYTSLLEKVGTALVEDEHFWNITAHDEWVLFQSLDRIYMYNTDKESFQVIDIPTNRAKIFNLGTQVFVQKTNAGIFSIQNGKPTLVPELDPLKDSVVVGMYEQQGKTLLITEDGGFFFLAEGRLVPWKVKGLSGLENLNVYSSSQLRDGSYVLGTISNGYIHVDTEGNLLEMVNQERGLVNNTVLSTYEDADGNLWLALDNGISCINLNSAFKVYTDLPGKLGVVYASLVVDGNLYLGTNQGLYYRPKEEEEGFRLVRGTNGQVWSLKSIGNTLFCAHTNGTFVVKGGQAKLISDFSGTWEVHALPGREDLLLQGNYDGLSLLKLEEGEWRFSHRVEGFDISSKTLAFSDTHRVVVNHEVKGIFVLDTDREWKRILKTANFGPAGYDSSISSLGNRIVYSSSEGIFDLDAENKSLASDSLLTKIYCDPSDRMSGKLIIDQKQNKAWGFSQGNILCLSPDIFDATPKVTKIPIPSYFRRNQGLTGFENVQWLGAQDYLIGTSVGYVVLDLEKVLEKDYEVRITSVEKQFRQADREKLPLLDSEQSLRYEENNLTFNFTVAEYDKYTEVNYQYLLDGLYDDWSAWSPEPYVSFGNLPHGEYAFRVRARIGNKTSENEAGFRFTVLKPWYLSGTAMALYALGIVLLMLLVHRSYRQHYSKQRNKLIEDNRRNMELAQLESEQEIMQLKNEQLRMDIESKNRELAITTMSLINKNELLQGIKNDLLHLQDKSSRDHVVKVINRNLNNDHDWDYFQEAFNNADKDFLKKVHKLHPNLTPNDLKLCAYLRLNLSSKEIAPLLNISVRSVEIKRYRLRKKMQLEHEKSLVEHILEI